MQLVLFLTTIWLLLVLAWLGATAIVYAGWRRYPSQAAQIALFGFGLGLAGYLLLPLASGLGFLRFVLLLPFIGAILIVYAFWAVGRQPVPPVDPGGDWSPQ